MYGATEGARRVQVGEETFLIAERYGACTVVMKEATGERRILTDLARALLPPIHPFELAAVVWEQGKVIPNDEDPPTG